MHNNPNTKPELFKAVKVFLSILLAALFFVAPIPVPTAPLATTPIPSQTPEIGGQQ